MDRRLKIKRIKYLCSRRASQEMEIVLQRFINKINLENLTDEEIDELIKVLSMDDITLRDVLYGLKDVPSENKKIIGIIEEFNCMQRRK